MFNRLDTISVCDWRRNRRTGRQTDNFTTAKTALCRASRW